MRVKRATFTFIKNAKNGDFWKPEVGGQTVLPDFISKCDFFSNFQTLCLLLLQSYFSPETKSPTSFYKFVKSLLSVVKMKIGIPWKQLSWSAPVDLKKETNSQWEFMTIAPSRYMPPMPWWLVEIKMGQLLPTSGLWTWPQQPPHQDQPWKLEEYGMDVRFSKMEPNPMELWQVGTI